MAAKDCDSEEITVECTGTTPSGRTPEPRSGPIASRPGRVGPDLPEPPDPTWPAPGWERYRCHRRLGEGGAGIVFQAWDTRLNRWVAVKFLKLESAELVARFFREAQAQAHIEHPHVCKVYEVGEVQGHAYIAMQFIAGDSLKHCYGDMALEQRILVMKKVAEAVHAAHRCGIVHRDLKSANIMLESTEENAWHPYVVDFGLVREEGNENLTVSGTTLGTPSYMSPEQARGRTEAVDRRSDVYSLGATLYEIATGRLPFTGSNPVEILLHVIDEDPVRPRRVAPRLPEDVETIVMKCLEKDPGRRYDSAKALAEDLGRFLEGEPVLARRHGLGYKLWKKAWKYKALTLVALLALSSVAAMAALWWNGQRKAALQAEYTRRFEQRLALAENLWWKARSLPLHDIRSQRANARKILDALAADMAQAGELAVGPGHAALGRGYLALQDYGEARRHLAAAWQAGNRAPDTACALGLAYGNLYQSELESVQRILDKTLRDARKAAAEKALRDPALFYIAQGRGAQALPADYVNAYLAYLEQNHEKALLLARRAFAAAPWLFEAKQLEGSILQLQAEKSARKADPAASADFSQKAEQALQQAAEIARSDPGTLHHLAGFYSRINYHNVWLFQRKDPAVRARALETCRRGLIADPDDLQFQTQQLSVYIDWAEAALRAGEMGCPDVDAAVALGRKLSALHPRDAKVAHLLAMALWQKGKSLIFVDIPTCQAPLREAAQRLESILPQDPADLEVLNGLGLIYLEMANLEGYQHRDPTVFVERGEKVFARALELSPKLYSVNINRALILGELAEYQLGKGLAEGLSTSARALACLQGAEAQAQSSFWIFRTRAEIRSKMAMFRMDKGQDPAADAAEALGAFDRALAINGSERETLVELVDLCVAAAKFQAGRGQPSRAWRERARKALATLVSAYGPADPLYAKWKTLLAGL